MIASLLFLFAFMLVVGFLVALMCGGLGWANGLLVFHPNAKKISMAKWIIPLNIATLASVTALATFTAYRLSLTAGIIYFISYLAGFSIAMVQVKRKII